jgi:hypothetical protein
MAYPLLLGELIRHPNMGKEVYRAARTFPHLNVTASVQPITREVRKANFYN